MKNQELSTANKQRGQMGIIGALLALAIIGIALYFAISHFSQGKTEQTAQAESTNAIAIISGVQKFYATNPTQMSTATPEILVQAGFVPAQDTAGGVVNAFQSPVGVAPATLLSGSAGLGLTYTVPKAACVNFVEGVATSTDSTSVGGTQVYPAATGAQIDSNALAAQCGAATTNATVVLNVAP